MENTTLNTEIKRVAKNISRFVLRYKGEDLKNRINSILQVELSNFESFGLAKTLVLKNLPKEIYETIYIPIGMDVNGNYTQNKNVWV
jgi:hypothetical protein